MRYRATILVIQEGRILLVRDKHRHDFSLPGGAYKLHESTLQAAIREIGEELGLKVNSAERLRYCDFNGQRAYHKVAKLTVHGQPILNRTELSEFLWWDMKSHIPTQGHVKKILTEYRIHGSF